MTIQSKSREYNGERKMRHSVVSVKQVDYAADAKKLLDIINRWG